MCRATAVRRWEIDLRGQNHTSTHLLDQHAGGHQALPVRRQHRQHWQHQQPWAAQLSSSLTSGEQRGRDLPALLCLELLQVGKPQTSQNQHWWKITILSISIVLKTNRSCCSGTAREHKRKGIVWKSEAILNQKCNVNRSSSPWSSSPWSSSAEESRNGCLSDQQKERRPSAEFAVLQVVLYPDSTHATSNPSIIGIIFYKLLYPKHWNKFIQYLVSITTNLSHI